MEFKQLAFPNIKECDNVIIIKKARHLGPMGMSTAIFDSADYVKLDGKILKNR